MMGWSDDLPRRSREDWDWDWDQATVGNRETGNVTEGSEPGSFIFFFNWGTLRTPKLGTNSFSIFHISISQALF